MEIEVLNNFSFETTVLRTEVDSNGELYLIGVASSDIKDYHNTIFNSDCQRGFLEDVQNETIIVEMFHEQNEKRPKFTQSIGKVVEASTQIEDDKTKFITKIKLNKRNPQAQWIYDIVQEPLVEFGEPTQLGLSIWGYVKKWHYENIDGQTIKVFDRVSLKRIAITDKPSNKDTFLECISRSIDSIENNNKKEEVISRMFARDENGNVKMSDVKTQLNLQMQEFMNEINKAYTAGFTAENTLNILKGFIEKYEDIMQQTIWEAKWNCCVDDSMEEATMDSSSEDVVSEACVKREKEVNQNKFIEQINNLLELNKVSREQVQNIEKNIEEKENGRTIKNESKRTTCDTCDSSRQDSSTCDTESCNRSCEESQSSIVQREEEEAKVEQEVIQVETVDVEKIVENKLETVSREIVSTLQISIDSLLQEINSLNKSIETISREVEVIKNQPASTPANTIQVVSREQSLSEKERYEKGLMSKQEAEKFRDKVFKNLFGVRQ